MHIRNIDLMLVVSIALLNILWALSPNHPPVIGIVLTLPLVFLLPGYALTEALFCKHNLEFIRHFTIIIALNISEDILSGFILNIFPTGLHVDSWAICLGLLTVVFSLLAAYLRRGSSVGERQLPKLNLSIRSYVLLGLSIVIAFLSLEYSTIQGAQQPHPDLTQLWMLPSPQTNNNCAVRLGIHSFETTSQTYRITLAVNGIQVNKWSSIVLAPQKEWERLVPIFPRSTSNVYVEVWLYQLGKPETAYHEVHVTLKRPGGSKDQRMQC